MIETGKILELIDKNHFLFQGKTEKYWIGHIRSFGQLEVGKNVTLNLVERFTANSFFKIPSGNFKLVNIYNPYVTTIASEFLEFKKLDSNIEINVTIVSSNFNNNILGENYDLSLLENYKGRNFFQNLPENKTCNNYEVIILNKLKQFYYLVLYNNKIICLTYQDSLDEYIGQSILIELYKKFLATNIFIGETFLTIPQDIFTFQYSNNSGNFCLKGSDDFVLVSNDKINSNNIGKNLTINYYPLKYSDLFLFKESTTNNGFKLLEIIQGKDLFYIFNDINNPNDIFAISASDNVNLNNKLGSLFLFNSNYLFLLSYMEPVIDTSGYCFIQVLINNIHVFTKNSIKFYVNMDVFELSNSSIGKYYNLTLTKLLLQSSIINVQ